MELSGPYKPGWNFTPVTHKAIYRGLFGYKSIYNDRDGANLVETWTTVDGRNPANHLGCIKPM